MSSSAFRSLAGARGPDPRGRGSLRRGTTSAGRRAAVVFAILGLSLASCRDAIGPTGGVMQVGFDPAPPGSLVVGQSVQLNPIPLGSNGRPLAIACIQEFVTSDPSIATVDANGVVTALAEGTVVLTVRLNSVPTEVTLAINGPEPSHTLRLSAANAGFTAEQGGGNPPAQTVMVTSDEGAVSGLAAEVVYLAGQPSGWLSAQLGGTSTPAPLNLSANVAGLPAGAYHAWVVVNGADAYSAVVQVTLVVSATDGRPTLQLSAPNVGFSATEGGGNPAAQAVQVTSSGGAVGGLQVQVTYPAGGTSGWLTAELLGSSTPAGLRLSPNVAGLAPGVHHATVTITGNQANPAIVQVVLVVNAADERPSVQLSASNVGFSATQGGASPAPQTVQVTSSGDAVSGLHAQIAYGSGGASGWLTAELLGSSTPAGLRLTPNVQGVPAGVHHATVTVTGSGADPAVVQVVLVVQAADDRANLQTSAANVDFTATQGAGNPPGRTLQITSDASAVSGLHAQISYGSGGQSGWLTATLAASTTPTSLSLAVDATGLSAGTYTATVVVTGTNANPAVVTVKLTVLPAPTADLIGLELEVDANVLGGGGLLELDLKRLLSDPILAVTVWALYSDGSRHDVTNVAALTTSDPLLEVDGPGVLNLAGVLVRALLDPEHYLHAEYQGFVANATIRINVPGLGTLPILGLKLPESLQGVELEVGTALPQVLALLDDGIGGTVELLIPGAHADVQWRIVPRLVNCSTLSPLLLVSCNTLNGLLQGLGNLVGGAVDITGGVVQKIELGPLQPIINLLGVLGLETGKLSVDISAVVDGIVSDAVPCLLRL